MTFTTRLTSSGKRKQAADELEGWKRLVSACHGTTSHAQVNALSIRATGGHITGWNSTHANYANYANWEQAHIRYTRKARRERQRAQRELKRGPVQHGHPIQLCQVDPHLNLRDTLRVAIVTQATSDQGATLNQTLPPPYGDLLKYLTKKLTQVDDELDRRDRHSEAHDLRINGHPPQRLFVAAEWFFRPSGRPHTSIEKDAIVQGLLQLSRTFPDWTLVPGTIYWSPTAQTAPPLHTFNMAVTFRAGAVLKVRMKRNEHDHLSQNERWGPDHVDVNALPAGVTAASLLAPARWTQGGKERCLDICRDHYVGEAAGGYAQSHPNNPGAHVYVVTANGTTVREAFLATRNNGLFVFCDGGNNAYRVTRANLDTVTLQIGTFRTAEAAFLTNRETHRTNKCQGEANKATLDQDQHFLAFRTLYRALCPSDSNPQSSDPNVRGHLDVQWPVPWVFAGQALANRYEYLLDPGTGWPADNTVTQESVAAVTRYVAALRQIETARLAIAALEQTAGTDKQTLDTASNATKAEVTLREPAEPRHTRVFQLLAL